MSVYGWIIIHQRVGHTFNWNMPWSNYKNGFGSIDADFWLGLKKIHPLTKSQPYRLRVELQQESTNRWYSAEYWSFRVGNEAEERYRLYVAHYSGDAGDKLNYHYGMHFTTRDRDNDQRTEYNCASSRGGGW